VDIRLWNDITASVNLPLLLLVTFLAGLIPTFIYHHAVRWRLRQRLAAAERRVAVPAPLPVPEPVIPSGPLTADPLTPTAAPSA
jgi:hypothetical protein